METNKKVKMAMCVVCQAYQDEDKMLFIEYKTPQGDGLLKRKGFICTECQEQRNTTNIIKVKGGNEENE